MQEEAEVKALVDNRWQHNEIGASKQEAEASEKETAADKNMREAEASRAHRQQGAMVGGTHGFRATSE